MEKLQPRWSWRKPNLIQVAKYYSPGSIRSVMALFGEPEFGESGGTGCIRSAATLSGDIYGTNTNGIIGGGIIGDTLIFTSYWTTAEDVDSMERVRLRRGLALAGTLMRCAKILNLLPQSAQNNK
jgi:hypothetical protein